LKHSEQAPEAVDTAAIRSDLNARGTKPIIPPKSNPMRGAATARTLRMRNWIERVIGHFKTNRHRHRYDQLADSVLNAIRCSRSSFTGPVFVRAALEQ
jgi:hypothetical protein